MKQHFSIPLLLAIFLAAVLFWPTLFRYESFGVGDEGSLLRIHRVTGHTESFDGESWVPAEWTPVNPFGEMLSKSSTESVAIDAHYVPQTGELIGTVYNGSEWTVTGVQIFGTAYDSGGDPEWTGTFREAVMVQPYSVSPLVIPIENGEIPRSIWETTVIYGSRR